MNIKKTIVMLCAGTILSISCYGQQRGNAAGVIADKPSYNEKDKITVRQQKQSHGGYQPGVDIPAGTHLPGNVARTRLEIDTAKNAPKYKSAQISRYNRKKVLNEIFDPVVLMTPVKRTIRSQDIIGISPAFITQIVFPDNMEITDAVASFPANIFKFTKNLLRLRPNSRDFYSGNIVLTLTDGTTNYAMNIFVDRYYQEDCRIDNGEYICKKASVVGVDRNGKKKYKYAYNNLSTFYVYTNPQKIDELKAFSIYERLSGHTLNIDKEGDSVSFRYNGIYYRIIKDSINGTIIYNSNKYRVVPEG